MPTTSRLYLLSKLTDGERAMIDRLEREVRAATVKQHGASEVRFPLPPHVSEQVARTLAELYALAGWQAGLDRRDGLSLVLRRSSAV